MYVYLNFWVYGGGFINKIMVWVYINCKMYYIYVY